MYKLGRPLSSKHVARRGDIPILSLELPLFEVDLAFLCCVELSCSTRRSLRSSLFMILTVQ